MHGLRLLAQVEGIHGLHLHLEGEFISLQPGFQLPVLAELLRVHLVELVKQIELPALLRQGDELVADILNQLFDLGVFRVDVGSLKNTREKSALPVL